MNFSLRQCRCGSGRSGRGYTPRRSWSRKILAVCLLLFLVGGCRRAEEIREDYAIRGGRAGSSVNGIGVLADMFEAQGCDVFSWRRLSPKLNDYRVIVWAPDDFLGPTLEQREFLDNWLKEDTGRTLVYIGRDYDAVTQYWQEVLPSAAADQQPEIARRLAQAQSEHDEARVNMPVEEISDWFVIRRDRPRRRVAVLSGPWSEEVAAPQTDIWVQGRLQVPTAAELGTLDKDGSKVQLSYARFETLLESDDLELVYRVVRPDWGTNQVIVVVNGSFLLNLPLVNVEHRKIAGHLIRECRTQGQDRKVAIIESGLGGPTVHSTEPKVRDPEAARRRVLLAIHWVVLGMLYCLSIFPLFGRPKPGPPDTVAEFSQHVDALGSLLEKTHDQAYAQHQLEQYRAKY